ncbi:MAG: N-acetylmuramoyl-L-alanine amidase [Clostridium sp.]
MKGKKYWLFIGIIPMILIVIIMLNRNEKMDVDTQSLYKQEETFKDNKIIIEPLSNDFKINRPNNEGLKTGEKNLVITGEADPNKELFINGEKVDIYFTGNFIKVVPLDIGKNTFEFKLGDKIENVKVEREFKIINSISPAKVLKIEEGKKIIVTAKLYSGAKAYGIINGEKIELKQIQSEEFIGARETSYAEFSGEFIAPNVSKESNLGKIKIVAEYDGKTQEEFGGEVIITSKKEEGNRIAILINDSVKVYNDENTSVVPLLDKAPLPKGTIDSILSETIIDSKEYYNLMSGVKVKKEDVQIKSESFSTTGNKISEGELGDNDKYTTLKLKTDRKVPFTLNLTPMNYKDSYNDDYTINEYKPTQVIINFNYTNAISDIKINDNKLFSDVKISGNEIILDLKEGAGGYNGHFSFYDKDGYLNIQFTNKINSLKGANIIIDPGHGFSGSKWKDSGALGWNEINEQNLNIKISTLLEKKLSEKGANVIRLKTEEKTYKLNDRGKFARENNGDVYISIHHNSGGFGKINATETYYNTPFSMELAKKVNDSLVDCYKNILFKGKNDDFNRGDKNNSFIVTLERECPSVLVEVGYMDNPVSFNKLIDEEYQLEIVNSIVEGIENYCYNN